MKLITKEILKAFERQGDTSEMKPEDTKVIVKFFNPVGRGKWYATEYDPETRTFFGFVSLFGDHNDELGCFSLDELENLRLPLGMKIERDLHFTDYTLSQVMGGIR